MAFSSSSILTFHIALTILAWGMWGIFDKLALAKSEPKDVFFATGILAVPQIPIVLALLNWTADSWHISISLILFASASSLLSSVGMAVYLDSMKRIDSSVVLGLTAAYPVVTQILGLVVLGESFSPGRALGAFVIAIGVVVIGLTDNLSPMLWQPSTALPPEDTQKKKDTAKTEGFFTSIPVFEALLLVNLAWGCKGILEKLSLQYGTPLETYLTESVTNLLLLVPVLCFMIWRGYRPKLKSRSLWTYTGLSELSLAIGGWSYLLALSLAPASYVVTLASTYPIVMYVIAVVFLKEKVNALRLVGLLCIAGGGTLV